MSDWKDNFPKENRYFETDNGILYNGDCENVLKEFSGNIKTVITSPPYLGIQKYVNEILWINNDELYYKKILSIVEIIDKIMDDDGVFILNLGDKKKDKELTLYPFITIDNIRRNTNFKLYENLIWNKKSNAPKPKSFVNIYEYLFVMVKNLNNFVFNIDEIRVRYSDNTLKRLEYDVSKSLISDTSEERSNKGKKNIKPNPKGALPKNILDFSPHTKEAGNIKHTASFPKELIEYLMKGFSNKGDIVLDPFMGSGTTAIVAERLNRRWIGIELSEEYCEIAKQRIIKETDANIYKLFG